MRHHILHICLLLFCSVCIQAQTNQMGEPDYTKLSPHLQKIIHTQQRSVLALMSFDSAADVSATIAEHGCRMVDSIGRIYIVQIPLTMVASLSKDERVERIEAEPMPSMRGMDVTPGQIDATPAYAVQLTTNSPSTTGSTLIRLE